MFSLSFPLAQGMPWLFALALLPAALLRGFWWPARIAGGLGLALTKSLIELHRGRMIIESQPGHGTTVWFDLPIRAPEGAMAPTGATPQRVQSRAA